MGLINQKIKDCSFVSISERHGDFGIEGLNLSNFERPMQTATAVVQDFRIFVGTWNVGGRAPHQELNLEEFLQVEGSSDVYVLGFQEIVPLSAGNVLVIEDNEPAVRWLTLINQALNYKPSLSDQQNQASFDSSAVSNSMSNPSSKDSSKTHFFRKPSLKALSKNLRTADSSLLKACNCYLDSRNNEERPTGRRKTRKLLQDQGAAAGGSVRGHDPSMEEFMSTAGITTTTAGGGGGGPASSPTGGGNYSLVASKQMVGIFLTIWARKELMQHIAHLRISCLGRGIMGCLGNKGCISISLSLHQTSLCFVCSHLASGEKEGDEIKRNSDVAQILKSIQFPKICKHPTRTMPERIIDHDRTIWLGDLNYRVSLSYDETKLLLEDNNWDSLLEKDQLNLEKEAGRVFTGWKEGKIFFAPTYKYSQNSDSYAGENTKSKKKRRTPAWCDRILWKGGGVEQLSYVRGESRFSDHRPVCAVFGVEVEILNKNSKFRKGYSCAASGGVVEYYEEDDCVPKRHSFYDF
ncbi:type I inositol polyphosphate 5-phosphatase 5 [Impatiens glandulifera]|uniref:type I inositol polyphosphate 5-phosphatase 5 n=1 Tax=Impatiens glandulifera TaxID=253017 RepID=UPI001FB110EA|nr:type I inositol polyphosphate 5-phosphatase 5 [Impatiens glandulifera]